MLELLESRHRLADLLPLLMLQHLAPGADARLNEVGRSQHLTVQVLEAAKLFRFHQPDDRQLFSEDPDLPGT